MGCIALNQNRDAPRDACELSAPLNKVRALDYQLSPWLARNRFV